MGNFLWIERGDARPSVLSPDDRRMPKNINMNMHKHLLLLLSCLLSAVATPTTNFTTTRATLIHELFGLGPGVLPSDKIPMSVEPIPGPHMQGFAPAPTLVSATRLPASLVTT